MYIKDMAFSRDVFLEAELPTRSEAATFINMNKT